MRVTRVEKLSRLSFGLVHADPLATRGLEDETKELGQAADIVL